MQAVDFPRRNCTHTAEGCLPLPTCVQHNEQFDTQEVISCFELEDKDIAVMLQQLKNGERPAVFLCVVGGQPPVQMWVRGVDDGT